MAPTRKRSVNKRLLNEISPEKEVKSSSKNKQQANGKKKLSDKLGTQWSKEELRLFYKAYRDHGKNWRKVAAEVHDRSVEMVETLYNMNRAYLSLPEGTASVVGLIAMMTDHYSVLEASESERESNEVPEVLRKLQKRKRPKVQCSASKEDLQQSHMAASTDGCLSFLKRGYGHPLHSVGKRTPRFPVSHLHKKDNGEHYVSPKKKRRKSENNADDNDDEHVAALTLTETLQRGDSAQVPQTPHRRTEYMKSSPVQSWDRMPESSPENLCDASIYEHWSESGTGRGGTDLGYGRDASSLAEMEGIGTVEVHRKGKKFYGKKVRVEKIGNSQSDGGGEACSGTEEDPKVGILKGKAEIKMSNAKIDETFRRGQRKRSKKLFSDDEHDDFIGLQTLALVSAMEFESSAQLDEERTAQTGDDKCSVPESASTSHHREKTKLSRQKEKEISGVDGITSRKSMFGRCPLISTKPGSEANKQPRSISNGMLKRKRGALVSKVLDEEQISPVLKGRHNGQISSPLKQLKSLELPEGSSFSGDQKNVPNNLATAQVLVASQVILPTRKGSRRKMGLKRAMIPKGGKSSVNIRKIQINRQDGEIHCKGKLSCSLSSPMVRRWCTYEWFYSAVDYPWFAKREFVEYLNHVGLGHIPRLTRVEWGVIRSSLGRPRRFSERFLHEEREKLQQYRGSVRKHYMDLRTGLRKGLPTDLARPLSVGQRVIAIHPKTREIHDGSVLTVDHDQCRVQFDHAELGVEFVKDIDCMPSNPLDNMPENLRRQRISALPRGLLVNVKSNSREFTASENLGNAPSPKNALAKPAQVEAHCAIPLAKGVSTDIVNAQGVCSQPSMETQIQPKESDIRALSELNRALDRKASSALLNLRQHDTYLVNNLPAWLKPPANSCFSGMPRPHTTFVSQESGSAVLEIVRGSRLKAHNMVDVAVQAISSMKEGEDTFVRIGEALDSMDRRHSGSESRVRMIRAPDGANGGLRLQNQLIPSTSEPQVNSNASRPQSSDSDKTATAIPSELISSCVATLLMIQTCSERQYPPSDVAQIIDSAVTSLQPCCPQNLPIYREIQMCMGRIKTQILALIPT
ncbi:PROTEIN ALWAYS EARLY 1-RELATED [Salix purpurea]|uniref:PROTEIN ALWAYS EARLY 1-RELATED n=1 Tax=Salix purpurea TaxID=77065 RepID=A0A9Q0W8V5_SALPP|nr:PROTEIN ALWAYS EARLY 1-RELATED [Salix purpurea]